MTNHDYKRHLQLYYVTHYPISHPFPDNRENTQKAHIMGYYPICIFYMHYLRYITVPMQGDTNSVYSFIVNYSKPITHAPQLQSLNVIKMKGNNKSKQNKLYNKYSFIVKHQKQTLGGGNLGYPNYSLSMV